MVYESITTAKILINLITLTNTLYGGRRVSTSMWCPLVTAGLILLLRDTQRLRVGVETWRHRGVGGGWSHGEVQSFHHHEIRLPTILQQATRPRGVTDTIRKS